MTGTESRRPPFRGASFRMANGAYTNTGSAGNALAAANDRDGELSGHTSVRVAESARNVKRYSVGALATGDPSACMRFIVAAVTRPFASVRSYAVRDTAAPLRVTISPVNRVAVRANRSTATVSLPSR